MSSRYLISYSEIVLLLNTPRIIADQRSLFMVKKGSVSDYCSTRFLHIPVRMRSNMVTAQCMMGSGMTNAWIYSAQIGLWICKSWIYFIIYYFKWMKQQFCLLESPIFDSFGQVYSMHPAPRHCIRCVCKLRGVCFSISMNYPPYAVRRQPNASSCFTVGNHWIHVVIDLDRRSGLNL